MRTYRFVMTNSRRLVEPGLKVAALPVLKRELCTVASCLVSLSNVQIECQFFSPRVGRLGFWILTFLSWRISLVRTSAKHRKIKS